MAEVSGFIAELEEETLVKDAPQQPGTSGKSKNFWEMAVSGDEDDEEEDEEEEEVEVEDIIEQEEDEEEEEVEAQAEEEQEEEEVANPEWANMMINVFPDRTFEAVEDFDNAVLEHINDLQAAIQSRDEAHGDLIEIFKNYPQFAAMAKSLKNGDSDRVAIVKAGYSPEDFNIEEDDEDAEALVTAKIHLKESKKREVERQQKIQQNIQKSHTHLDSFKANRKVDDKKWDRFLSTMNNAVTSFMEGNITEDVIENFWKGLEFETEKEKAKNEGVIQGRNQKIVAEKKRKAGDGLPNLPKGSSAQSNRKIDPFTQGLREKRMSTPTGFIDELSR